LGGYYFIIVRILLFFTKRCVFMSIVECWGRKISISSDLLGETYLGIACYVFNQEESIDYTSRFESIIQQIRKSLRESYAGDPLRLKDDDIIRAYRAFFWKYKIDPTKTRPAGEALARRILRGGSIPLINPIVDSGNLASAITFVPIGLYDADKIPGDMVLRLSDGGEVFMPIGGGEKKLEKGVPILLSKTLVMHVYPHRDSVVTMVTKNTNNVLAIGAGVKGVPEERVLEALKLIVDYARALGIQVDVIREPTILK